MGSHLVDELVGMGHEVSVIDNLSGGFIENHNSESDLYIDDITDHDRVAYIFKTHKPQIVFHLAAYAAEGLSPFVRRYNYVNNMVGSANIINQSIIHKVEFFCFTSSMAVYGNQKAPFTEGMELMPIDPYGVAKAAVERDLEIAYQQHGLQYVVMRPHNVYGPRQNLGDPYRNVVGIWMRQIKNGEPLTIYGDGTQVREFTCIDDVTPYIARSYHHEYHLGRTFNLGLGERMSIWDMAVAVIEATGLTCDLQILPPRHEVKESYPSTVHFKDKFSPSEQTGLVNGLAKMWDWAKDAPVRRSKLPEIEVRDGLYPQWQELGKYGESMWGEYNSKEYWRNR
jgi:UDP-glucose 4-epimerase